MAAKIWSKGLIRLELFNLRASTGRAESTRKKQENPESGFRIETRFQIGTVSYQPAARAITVLAARPPKRIRTAIRGVPASQNHAITPRTANAIIAGTNFWCCVIVIVSSIWHVISKCELQNDPLPFELSGKRGHRVGCAQRRTRRLIERPRTRLCAVDDLLDLPVRANGELH